MNELIKCTGNVYLKNVSQKNINISNDKNTQINIVKNTIKQYYKIISYKSFSKKVLGEKILEKNIVNGKITKSFKKNKNGEIERDYGINRIFSLDNTLLIIDEAHNITNNDYGSSLKLISEKSKNLRIILITATPMKNVADEIVELLNYIKPSYDKLNKDKIFKYDNNNINNKLQLKTDGLNYLKKHSNGLISHFRGSNPLLFAQQIDNGEIPEELIFTKLIRCKMLPFQQECVDKIKIEKIDKLDKNMIAAANFVFPVLNDDKNEIVSDYSKSGLNKILNNIKNNKYIKMLNDKFFKNQDNKTIYEKNNNIAGNILKLDNLINFSIKFHTALVNINQLVFGKKGNKTAFIYSNLVKVGIDIFKNILLENGYLEYDEKQKYYIQDNTIDYKYGLTKKEFKLKYNNEEFIPAIFLSITGDKEYDSNSVINKTNIIKMKILMVKLLN